MNHSIENDQANPHFPIAAPQIYEAGDDWWLVTGDWWCESCSRCKPPQTHRTLPGRWWSNHRAAWVGALEQNAMTLGSCYPAISCWICWSLKIFLLRWKDSRVQADGLKHWWGVCRLLVDTCWCLLYVFVYLRHHQNLHVRPSPTSSNGWVPQSGSIFFVDLKLLLLYNRVQTL